MENKYYTPEIEEFHVGFEFEYLPPLWATGMERVWVKYSWVNKLAIVGLHDNCISIGNVTMKDNCLRVKFLDKDDIESLGWGWSENDMCWEIGDYIMDFEYEDHRICVEEYSDDKKFVGIIKNKAELEKLMVQLGIVK